MSRRILPIFATPLALAGLACVSVGGQAAAQTVREVTVEAPRSVSTRTEPSAGSTGALMLITTVRAPVDYSDLDLAKASDLATLRQRIKGAAVNACKQLDRLYPLQPDALCLDKAFVTASALGEGAVAAIPR